MTGRQRAVVLGGSGFAVVGLAVALVAWEGLDRANLDLGVPAAVAALLGLVVSVYGIRTSEPGEPSSARLLRRVKQRATATGRARIIQIGGSQGASGGSKVDGQARYETDQSARSAGDAQVTQVGGDEGVPEK